MRLRVLPGLLALAIGLAIGTTAVRAGIEGRLAIDGHPDGTVEPSQGARWTIAFRDPASGAQVTSFEAEHEKYMHLIVVPADLSTFAHIHPRFEAGSGIFVADVNTPTTDPDNQDAARAVTVSGPHFLFAEVKPAGQDVHLERFTLTATGPTTSTTPAPDPVDVYGRTAKYFDASGTLAAPGAELRVTFKSAVMKYSMLHLNFEVERRTAGARGAPPSYDLVDDLEEWLGMTAHAVMIGAEGSTIAERAFRHLHAGHHDHGAKASKATGELAFMLMDPDIPAQGVYRIWLQVKRQGRVYAFPFTFKF